MSIPFTQLDKLYIDGAWVAADGPREAVLNPATGGGDRSCTHR